MARPPSSPWPMISASRSRIVSSSGEGGAKLLRRNLGELVENVAAANEYHWMAGNFLKYAGPLNGTICRSISCADRAVRAAAGLHQRGRRAKATRGSMRSGMFMAEASAGPVYQLLGKKGPGTATFPAMETTLIDRRPGLPPAPLWTY